MKILFIFPNYDCPIGISIGVSYLSSILKNEGHKTKIIHICEEIGYEFNIDKIKKDIDQYKPGLIAISTGENHYVDMCRLSIEIKKVFDIPIAIGGVHSTINAKAIALDKNEFDFILLGDGEDSLKELAFALENKKDTTGILNIWSKEGRHLYQNKIRPLVNNFKLPPMDLDGWQFEKITKMRRGWVNISMNRGCPYRCSFCHNVAEVNVLKENFNAKGTSNKELGYLRVRDIDNMIDELKVIKNKYKYVREFSFIDDTFTFDKSHMLEFFQKYENEIGLPFVCLTTVNNLDEELIIAMKKANCDMIRFGVESATEHIRTQIINRSFSTEKIKEIFSLCKENGIRTFAYNIIAHPGEKIVEIKNTLKLNAELKPDGVRVSLGYPYKGTRYYDIAKKMGMLDENKNYHNYSTFTKFKFSLEDKLWIDKCRLYFKWWLNLYMNNEAAEKYRKCIHYIEQLDFKEWNTEAVRNQVMKIDEEISVELKKRNIEHYTSPYPDRPDIVVLFNGNLRVRREEIDEH